LVKYWKIVTFEIFRHAPDRISWLTGWEALAQIMVGRHW